MRIELVAVVMFANLTLTCLVLLYPANVRSTLEEFEIIAVFSIVLHHILHHKATIATLLGTFTFSGFSFN